MKQLDPKVLELEYNYIADMAKQTISDRYSFLNFYIALTTAVGTISVGLVSFTQSIEIELIKFGLLSLSILMSLIGIVFLLMMIRLRQAWHEAVTALNHLKAYYAEGSEQAFLWNKKTLPPMARGWNIHFYATLLIISISSLYLGIAVMILANELLVALLFGIASLVMQVYYYQFALKRNL